MAERKPDLIIAIDFGMTCTGVAWANVNLQTDKIYWIQKWPGRRQAAENKVPTILVYPTNSSVPSSWGFLADTQTEQSAENRESKEWFKTLLDEGELQRRRETARDTSSLPNSVEDVEKWYLDYFRLLYQYTQNHLQNEIPSRWDDTKIEFIFSVPTTWQPHPTVERFRKITERAGFGRSPNHTSVIGLTEAEAAAVFMSKEAKGLFKEGEILMVCDLGGGTSDLSVLRVENTDKNSLTLKQLDVVFGANIGAAQIDLGFQNSVLDRLQRSGLTGYIGDDLHDIAWQMMKSREFQNAKCEYGEEDETETFFVAIPQLSKQYTNESTGIISGEMRFRRTEIQKLLDTQIMRLYALIDRQFESMRTKFPNEQIAHLVISGGLGNNMYLQQRIRSRYALGASPFSNATSLKVRVAPDPQLVVCKGNVADRLEKVRSGVSVLNWRCCRSSFGTICKMLYNNQDPNHFGKKTVVDPNDKKIYVVDVVDWFIKQGEPVSVDYPIVKKFRQKISFKTPHRVFPVAVIESQVDKDILPYTFDNNCKKLCNVQSDFSTVALENFKLKNRHFWNFGEKYYRADYFIKVVIGPADINFELWFNGQKLSKDAPIKVEFSAAAAPPPPPPLFSSGMSEDAYMQTSLSHSPPPSASVWNLGTGANGINGAGGGPR